MKKTILKILCAIGIVPFAVPILFGLYNVIVGSKIGFFDTLLMYSFLYWYTYVLGLALIIVSVVMIKK